MKKKILTILFLLVGLMSAGEVQANPDYLCFTAEEAGATVQLNKSNDTDAEVAAKLEYSTDGSTWNDYTFTSVQEEIWYRHEGKSITLTNVGDKVYFRAKDTNSSFSSSEPKIPNIAI